MFSPRFFYTLGLWLLMPYVFFHLLWRGRKQPEYLLHIGERFGFYNAHSDKPLIWLHTVSVGETRAAASLIKRLHEKYPDHQLLLTHTTPTGRAASEQLYGNSVLRTYLPYDYPFAVKHFLSHFQPCIGILLETEIWFNLIHACHSNDIPLLLLNARLSEKSARGYARFAGLTRAALGELAVIAAQTTADAQRFGSLGGGNIAVTGNLKFDIEAPSGMLELGKQLRTLFGANRKIFLAASTREGEEELILQTLSRLAMPGLLTVIVPRHPQRFDEVASLLNKNGITFQRRSKNEPVSPDTQVVLGDSMGEMFAYYAASDIAFIGGSLLPFGGQNLIEACVVGTPVLIGPHTYNFAEATRLAVEAGAAAQVKNTDELLDALQRLLEQPEALGEMRQQCAGFIEANRGATEKSLRIIRLRTG